MAYDSNMGIYMTEYKIEYDVQHWQYVLYLDGEKILLGKQDIREAQWYAMMIKEGRRYRNDCGIGHSHTAHN